MDEISELRRESETTPLHGVWAKGGPVFSHLSEETVRGLEGRTIATFGDAATVGMWAFATGSLVAGLFQADLLRFAQKTLLIPELLAYSGGILILAGFFLFRRNNSYMGSAFCSFGSFNFTRGLLLLGISHGFWPAGATADCLQGVLFEAFAYIALSLFCGALRMNVVILLITIVTAIGYALAGLPLLTNEIGRGLYGELGRAAGFFMLAASALAYYGGSAILVNTAWQRVILPLGGQT